MIKPLGDRVMIEAIDKKKRQQVASYCRTQRKKNRKKAKL